MAVSQLPAAPAREQGGLVSRILHGFAVAYRQRVRYDMQRYLKHRYPRADELEHSLSWRHGVPVR